MVVYLLLGIVVGAAIGFGIGYYLWKTRWKPDQEAAHAQLTADLNKRREMAERELEVILNSAREDAKQIRADGERVIERRLDDLARAEERLDGIRASQDKQLKKLERREQNISRRQSNLDKRENSLKELEAERQETLQAVAGMTQAEAKQALLDSVEQEARHDMARVMREIEERARETADEQARKIIATSIQRIAGEHVAETSVALVEIPSDDMKGRIIGRSGRNIRAFEQAAGVDIVVDDTPSAVTVSSFDPVRREVARRALEKLIIDGRIHPARIEKVIKDAEKEVDKVIREAGEAAAYEANVHGLHREIIKTLGRLKFRTSYGQNQLHHSVEASKIAVMLAAELGADIEVAKMGGLLHDLGKAIDHNQEGTHAMLGAELARRFNVPSKVVNCIASHHHEVEQESVEAVIVETADAISGARPGARRESLENYIKRVRTLEEIAVSYDGVDSAYALQAGREIRVLVKPDKIDDLAAMRLSKEISKNIEDSMQYPGQIQVTIIRETRAVGFAK
ncbi:MAG: ribonuclease Y [Anaerolineae bacterium]|nr:ribonuclease Y [Anaerolineae bacterium]MCO5191269.1 ribonuclease Y [Anaerolineae bacterium]MCO5194845.1 ribonuclease Y [Anaerolineae bacterium]MCO5198421.1 ribonuclease Y [Anaerolineae bacterium]MCO5205875.1 ribonuclease Y [Anaerolineae bacterium]